LQSACLVYFRPDESRPHLNRFEWRLQSELMALRTKALGVGF
jgi:hypothetical protein